MGRQENAARTEMLKSAQLEEAKELGHPNEYEEPTLLSLIEAVNDVTNDDQEVIATVAHMLSSGRVRFRGHFQGESWPASFSQR
ncbi:MAG: hypothetical protein VX252_02235 [Myxococcota bacterium]|nr:hypothetical protein [Myxococcota bacterium]